MAQYGEGAKYTDRAKGVFDRAHASDETSGVEPVVEEFARLIDTPGTRVQYARTDQLNTSQCEPDGARTSAPVRERRLVSVANKFG